MFALLRQRRDDIVHIHEKAVPAYESRAIRHINDLLRHKFKRSIMNNFHFMNNDNITRETLWTDGLHLNNDSTYIFASNLVDL